MFNEVENLDMFDSRYVMLRMHGCMHVMMQRQILGIGRGEHLRVDLSMF